MAQPIDTLAIALYASLTAGESFTIPSINTSGSDWDIPGGASNPAFVAIPKLTNADLTNATLSGDGKSVDGTGIMDVLMNSFMVNLTREYNNSRISGAEYTKAYIAAMQIAAGSGVQYLVQRDAAYWQAVTAQMSLINARVQAAIGKTQLAQSQIDANTAKVNYALTKAKLSTESAGYISLSEQGESHRGQTMDTRSDGVTITGLIGKQKDLYSQQITSYQRDAEVKAGRLWTDAWITMKTIDEGIVPPDQFTNAEINEILVALKTNNNLGTV